MRIQATKTRGKAIIVDGNALFNMMRIIGVGTWKDKALYDVLTEGIGTSSPFGKPYITCKPEHTSKKKALELVGYEVELAESRGGYDDQCIRKRIQSFSSQEVDEIVFVGADEDMVGDLLKCAECGIKVIFVATHKEDPQSGNSMLSGHLQSLIDNGTFSFFELADKKEYLMKEPWRDREPDRQYIPSLRTPRGMQHQDHSPIQRQKKGRSISLAFTGDYEGTLATLLSSAGQFADTFNLKLTISADSADAMPADIETKGVLTQDLIVEGSQE